jgi:hypothetical protein
MVLRSFVILTHTQLMQNAVDMECNPKSIEVEFTPQCEEENLRYHCKVLNVKLKRTTTVN